MGTRPESGRGGGTTISIPRRFFLSYISPILAVLEPTKRRGVGLPKARWGVLAVPAWIIAIPGVSAVLPLLVLGLVLYIGWLSSTYTFPPKVVVVDVGFYVVVAAVVLLRLHVGQVLLVGVMVRRSGLRLLGRLDTGGTGLLGTGDFGLDVGILSVGRSAGISFHPAGGLGRPVVLVLTGAVRAARARRWGCCHWGRASDWRRGRVRVLLHF